MSFFIFAKTLEYQKISSTYLLKTFNKAYLDYLLSIKEIKVKQIIIIFLLIFINSAAFSHSQLTEILPEDNVTYNEVPPQIEMKFKSEVKLVKIDLIRVDIKEKIKLDSSLLKNKSNNYSIPMPKLDAGIYRFEWRALSPDGHIIKGKSDFEVK